MANFVCLAVARDWCAERHGAPSREVGLASFRQIPVFSSGYIHASATKSLALLGIGTDNVHKLTRDPAGRLDLDALERSLAGLDGAPAIVVANAGEVNAGDFDPIDAMADLADEMVRGFTSTAPSGSSRASRRSPPTSRPARNEPGPSPRTATSGSTSRTTAALRSSATPQRLATTFSEEAAYLPPADDSRANWGFMGPEGSRRARALAIWATLRAYGRSGYRLMVERHLELAQRLAERVDQEPELERLAEVPLNIVCFRWRPRGRATRARSAQPSPGRGTAAGRTGVRGNHRFRGQGRLPPRDRQLAYAAPRTWTRSSTSSSSSPAGCATSSARPRRRLRGPLRGSDTPSTRQILPSLKLIRQAKDVCSQDSASLPFRPRAACCSTVTTWSPASMISSGFDPKLRIRVRPQIEELGDLANAAVRTRNAWSGLERLIFDLRMKQLGEGRPVPRGERGVFPSHNLQVLPRHSARSISRRPRRMYGALLATIQPVLDLLAR